MNRKIKKIKLNNYKKNIYSQSGEDGIIEKLLENIDIEQSYEFVEFGAHDGKTNSNCYYLLETTDYFGLFIEPDKKRFKNLELNTQNMNCKNINSLVSTKGSTSLESTLKKNNISKNFDILSIDIDGYDYQIFKSLVSYKPKIVIVEYNPTIPNHVEYIQPDNFKTRHGSSPKSLIMLGKQKGYKPIAITDTNLFLLQDEIFGVSNFCELDLEESRDDEDIKINVFYGYNGDLIFTENEINFRWHFLKYKSKKLQPIPFFFRELLEDYSLLKNIVYKFYIFNKRLIAKIKRYLD